MSLYLVSTPIGNLEDITLRGLRVLAEVALVVAEDTRHSGRLLQHFDIESPLLSLHEHNEAARIPTVLAALERGDEVALISDAGTPTLSDPGYQLVRAVVAAGHRVIPVPGASALLAALAASGLPTDRFLFLGFPPRKVQARQQLLQNLAGEPGVLIFYESPRRLPALLQDAAQVFEPERPVVVARELTKIHETFWRGELVEAVAIFAEPPLGEVVVLFGGDAARRTAAPAEVTAALNTLLGAGISVSESSRLVAGLSGLSRKEVYRMALQAQEGGGRNVGKA